MKEKIHPEYKECTVKCGCGNTFTTRSTMSEIKVEICSACHPFYAGGEHKIMDREGRVDRFQKKFGGKYFAAKPAKSAKATARR